MQLDTPGDLVRRFVEAMNCADLDAAADCYEKSGILVASPGIVAEGREQIRQSLAAMLTIRPVLRTIAEEVLVSGNLALYHSHWRMTGTAADGHAVNVWGCSSDVLRRESDGRWRIAIDNPYGSAIVDPGVKR